MELVKGQVVYSRKGRDVQRPYVVLAVEPETRSQPQRAMLCNGSKWPLAAPKLKNVRHIQPTGTLLPAAQIQTDTDIKTALKPFWLGDEDPNQRKGG